ncbi:hypothetical protein PLESTB_001127900 [Pleodorina starrii]|uniref:Uncharacterized protein n=1 Tax=Pleodorina starrii TaxID=330485 RepID=A0A9W6F4W2_9CHLO|nr:hypothetical protein PLESTM_001365500 [Pleodorina starrii]GLC56623.1 hypothetical protein PLESTB_001127900 [Pleodorina starrii]GLC76211.1 hypothetical protein PLESTF_001750100 [Pleodorina starrii]
MALKSAILRRNGFHRASQPDSRHGTVIPAATTKSGKGFGGGRKQEIQKHKRDGAANDDRQVFKEAAAAISSHRPVKPEEAARGKLDYVQVADWGDGDRGKLGELRLVSHVQQYEGGAADGDDAAAAAGGPGGPGGGPGGGRRPFHLQLAHQLKLAEARGALAVAGPPPPSVSEWSFREERYEQYLEDVLEVHTALEAALLEATAAAAAATPSATPSAASGSAGPASTSTATGGRSDAAETSPLSSAAAAAAPAQGAVHALRHLAPGVLGLERSAAIRRDLAALRATAGHHHQEHDHDHQPVLEARRAATVATEGAEAGGSSSGGGGAAAAVNVAESSSGLGLGTAAAVSSSSSSAAGPMARSYAQVLRRLGRTATSGEGEQERSGAALRLLAHAAVLHLVAQAVWARVGAAAAERLALLQRRAAATYHEYPQQVTDPRVRLSRALDGAGEHLHSPAARQVVYDEVAGAMQKTGLLLSALAHRE